MPVLSFGVDSFALVRPHILILHVVQMQHGSRFADLVVCREVRGVHLSPNYVRNGTRKEFEWRVTSKQQVTFFYMNLNQKRETYFPKAKHSKVILEASMAVVSGNLTLMSAGYFLSPECQTSNKTHQLLQKKQKTKTVHFQQRSFLPLTLVRRQRDERNELGEDALSDDGAGNEAGVVSGVLRFHLGDVQVPRLLGDKAAAVRVQEKREFVVDPAVGHLNCNTGR